MFVVDTNFLMKDYKNLELINDDVMVPITVIDELDNHKIDVGPVGYNSRRSLRLINDAIDNDGLMKNGFKMFFDDNEYENIQKNDHKIIACTQNTTGAKLFTGDVGMKIRAKLKGIDVKIDLDDDNILNPGAVNELEIDYELLQQLFNDGKIPYEDIEHEMNHKNSCFMVYDKARTGSAIIRRIDDYFVKINQPRNIYGKITGKNIAQRLYLDMLMDPRIKVILVNGIAGSGKTLLALAAGLHLRKQKKFDDVVCAKSVEEIGKGIGFLPGEEDSKLGPFYEAFRDNLIFLSSASKEKGGELVRNIPDVGFEHIGFMRGRTFPNTFMIFDETQNLSPNEIKTCISRAGEGSKVVCCGDLHQIDNNQSMYTNGLFHAQRKLIGNEIVGVITLSKSERSDIAKLSALL